MEPQLRRLLSALAALLASGAAWADEYHYNDAQLGARAAGQGGAVVALEDAAASAYYNPACIPRDRGVEISLSATALQVKSRTYTPYLGGPATERSVGLVPNSSAVSSPWGQGRVSFSAFTLQDTEYVLDRDFTPPASTGISSARIRRIDGESTYFLGPSLGTPVSGTLSIGISAFLVYRSVTFREQSYQESLDPRDAAAALERNVDTDQVSTGLAVAAGVLWQPGGPHGRLSLGAALRSGASLRDVAHRREEALVGTRGADGNITFNRQPINESADARSGIPSEAALGGSLRLGRLRLSADGTAYSAQDYQSLGVRVEKRLIANGTLGAEWELEPEWTLRAGAFTNRSSAPAVRDDTSDQPSHIDEYGLTAGFTHAGAQHATDYALKLVRATGYAKVPGAHGNLTRAEVEGFEVTLVLGGSYRL